MSNALSILTSQLASATKSKVAYEVMTICRAITPQFYRTLSDIEIKAERASIELLTAHIEPLVLAKACELAITNYGTSRSDNAKTYFDINYILTQYRMAFNYIHHDSVGIPNDHYWQCSEFDPSMRIITECWANALRTSEIILKYIVDTNYRNKSHGRHYTPKHYEIFLQRSLAHNQQLVLF